MTEQLPSSIRSAPRSENRSSGRRAILGCCCVSVAGLLSLFGAAVLLAPHNSVLAILRGEAFFHGKPSSYWADILDAEGASRALTSETLNAIQSEPRAVAVLDQCLDDPRASVRWAATRLFPRCALYREQVIALQRMAHDSTSDVQIEALVGLARLGREALPARTQLVPLARSSEENVAAAARYALWSIDELTAQQAEEWMTHDFPRLGFSARFPGQVKSALPNSEPLQPGLQVRSATLGHVQVVVAVKDLGPADYAPVDERYDLAATMAAKGLNGTVDSNEKMMNGPFVGRDQRITSGSGMTMRSHFFILENRSYHATTVFRIETLHPSAIEYFLSGLKIHVPETDDID